MTEKPVRTEMPNAIELSIVKKFRKTIWTKFLKGIKEYELIQAGDKTAVCISGGKDSMLMAMCMKRLQRYSKVPFGSRCGWILSRSCSAVPEPAENARFISAAGGICCTVGINVTATISMCPMKPVR